MFLKSSAFENGTTIPAKYTCQGQDISPPFSIEEIPKGTKSFVLIIDDPDAPSKTWIHWVVYDIHPIEKIGENTIPGVEGANDFGRTSYGGPCPPYGVHRYFFKLYALDCQLGLEEGASKKQVEKAMEGHILEKAELIGLYEKR